MPANLTAEAKAKCAKAQEARTPREEIAALQEFLSAIPKHKGNERLRAQIRRRISLLKSEAQAKGRQGTTRASERTLEKAGAAQVAIVGMTNVGRSSLLAALTQAKPLVASYPFATKQNIPGMFQFEDLQFQLVELPALVPANDGRPTFQEGANDLLRNCDALIIMVDLTANPVEQLKEILSELARLQTSAVKLEANITVKKTRSGGLQLIAAGRLVGCTREQVESLLRSYGISHAMVRMKGDVSLGEIEDVILETNLVYKPSLIVANKMDIREISENVNRIIDYAGSRLPVLVTSCLTRQGLSELGRRLFELLEFARVYTKEPNASEPSTDPFVVRTGTTTGELSRQIHSTLFRRFRYARVWGKSVSYSGERVGVDHALLDGDIVEIHA